jgi:hypothetical protein
MWLSVASCRTRVASRNQRRTRTAWLKGLSAREPVRMPRRRRSACSRPDRYNTVWSRTGRVAVYVTLIGRRTSMKLISEGPPSYRGSAFCVVPQQVRRVAAHSTRCHRRLRGKPQWVGIDPQTILLPTLLPMENQSSRRTGRRQAIFPLHRPRTSGHHSVPSRLSMWTPGDGSGGSAWGSVVPAPSMSTRSKAARISSTRVRGSLPRRLTVW